MRVIFKTIKILCVIICIIFVLLLLVRIGEKIMFGSFYSNSDREFKTPGFKDGFVQQGFTYYEDEELFLVSGYMTKDRASRIYMVDEDGKATYVTLKNADGSDYTSHAGGIAIFENYVYLANADEALIDVFPLDQVLDGGVASKTDSFATGEMIPAFCYIYEAENGDSYLITGEFYREDDYETPESHRLTTPAGAQNNALAYVYKLSSEATLGIENGVRALISLPNQVQGLCITDAGNLVVSTSWGLSKSHIYVYDTTALVAGESDVLGETLPIYYLDSATMTADITAPPMAEELVYLDGELYIMNESASAKYIFGRFLSGKRIFAYEMD